MIPEFSGKFSRGGTRHLQWRSGFCFRSFNLILEITNCCLLCGSIRDPDWQGSDTAVIQKVLKNKCFIIEGSFFRDLCRNYWKFYAVSVAMVVCVQMTKPLKQVPVGQDPGSVPYPRPWEYLNHQNQASEQLTVFFYTTVRDRGVCNQQPLRSILLDWSCGFKLNGALIPDLLLLMSPLQPQIIAEEQAGPLTDFCALGAVKHPKRNNDLCSTFLRMRCVFLATEKTLRRKYQPIALNGWPSGLEGDSIIFWVTIKWPLALHCWTIHFPLYPPPKSSVVLEKVFTTLSCWTVSVWILNICNNTAKPSK